MNHVKSGLSQTPKKLSSRYFYDEKGDELFQQIMNLEEYYLPASEMEIMETQGDQIAKNISEEHQELQIVELGAGDGRKTKHFLKQIFPFFQQFEYLALDISPNILEVNKQEVESYVSGLIQSSISGNYFETYKILRKTPKGKMVLFLGANIGNFTFVEAVSFFELVKSRLKGRDCLLVSFDLVKHPRKIIKAYDDSLGITKQFNLNLFERINRELEADFEVSQYDHFPFYDPISGITSSHLFSLEDQQVHFPDGFVAEFHAFEAIHVEVSKKYFWKDIEELALNSGMNIRSSYFDKNKEYAFVIFCRND